MLCDELCSVDINIVNSTSVHLQSVWLCELSTVLPQQRLQRNLGGDSSGNKTTINPKMSGLPTGLHFHKCELM